MNIDIKRIAKLARLRINNEELAKFEQDMQNIVDMVENIPDINDELELDTKNPMKLRKDIIVTNKFTRDELMKNAPEVQAGCIVVPKIVE